MTPENQQEILRTFSQLMDEVSKVFELEPFTYEKGFDWLRTYGQRSLFALLLPIVGKVVPSLAVDGTLTVDHIPQILDTFATREKAEALLLQIPEEPADNVARILNELQLLLPNLRGWMGKVAKKLPHDPGDRPPLLSAPDDMERIRRQVGDLVARGWPLPQAKVKVAKLEGVSLSTFARRWRESERTVDKTDLE